MMENLDTCIVVHLYVGLIVSKAQEPSANYKVNKAVNLKG